MSQHILPSDSIQNESSPFDRIRQVRPDGSEFWSARDLMPLMGYSRWENFATPIDRAMKTAWNQSMDVDDLFLRYQEKTAGRPREDFELARYAAYLVAMNGDPNIQNVADAQHYFAIQTRVAETTPVQFSIPQTMSEALRLAADQFDRAEVAEKKVAELEPKAEFYDDLMDADGTYTFAATARILGWGRNVMLSQFRRLGILQSNNLPYRRYDHHFKVTPGTYFNRKTHETVPTATTTVRPSGLQFLRKKLDSITEPVQLELVGADA